MNKTKFSLIALLLSIGFLTLDFFQLNFNLGYDQSWSAYLEIDTIDLLLRYILIFILYIFVFLISYIFFEQKIKTFNINTYEYSLDKLKLINNISLLVLSSFAIYNLFSIFNYGLLNFTIEVRAGLRSLGGLYYFTTIALLSSLICSISIKYKNWIFYLSLIIFSIYVLSSGFRNFFVFLIIYWYLFYHFETKKIINIQVVSLLFLVVSVFYLFQYFRTDGEIGAYLVDIFNRTAPLSHSFVSDLNSDLFMPELIVFNFFIPFLTIFSTFGGYEFINWNEVIVNESVFRDYMNWRGTYFNRATGYAINYFIYSYIVAGYGGLMFFSLIYINMLLASFLLLGNIRLWNFGLIIISSIFMGIIDSTIEAFILVQYVLIYYSFLVFSSWFINKI
jgi:hypothetical protein